MSNFTLTWYPLHPFHRGWIGIRGSNPVVLVRSIPESATDYMVLIAWPTSLERHVISTKWSDPTREAERLYRERVETLEKP